MRQVDAKLKASPRLHSETFFNKIERKISYRSPSLMDAEMKIPTKKISGHRPKHAVFRQSTGEHKHSILSGRGLSEKTSHITFQNKGEV